MSLFLSFLTAASFDDLSPLAREVLAGCEEQFQEEFLPLKPSAKQNFLLGTLDDCIEHDIKTDKGFLMCMRYSMWGDSEDFDDHLAEMQTCSDPCESVQSVSVPTYSDSGHRSASVVSSPIEKESLKEALEEFFAPKAVSRTGRRSTNNPKNSKFRCGVCGLCLSSHGALYNHATSSGHKSGLLAAFEKLREHALKPSHVVMVTYRKNSKEERPKLWNADPSKYLEALTAYVQSDHSNPITEVYVRENRKIWVEERQDYRYETHDYHP